MNQVNLQKAHSDCLIEISKNENRNKNSFQPGRKKIVRPLIVNINHALKCSGFDYSYAATSNQKRKDVKNGERKTEKYKLTNYIKEERLRK